MYKKKIKNTQKMRTMPVNRIRLLHYLQCFKCEVERMKC